MSKSVSKRRAEILAEVKETVAEGPFKPTWPSLQKKDIPLWYREGKFGIFIHWGVYSVPAFGNEWYARNMYIEGTPEFEHHRATFGDQSKFGYKDFIKDFTADKFDATKWANLFKRAGAKFVVPVAEHHDGFAMYDTTLSRWNAKAMGPKRDIIGELSEAVRKESLTFGLSTHRAEHWFFMNGGTKYESDVLDPQYADFYGPAERSELQPTKEYRDDWLARTAELVDLYHPELVWFDWWIEEPSWESYLQRFATYYYNRAAEWDREVAINYKYDAFPDGAAVFDVERGQLADIRPVFWQTDTSVSKNSWSYIVNHDYKPVLALIADLVDIVAKNGALLLNIGPKPDGTIPAPEIKMLEEIGAWLDVNGEAIYGTTHWTIAGEGPTSVPEGAFTDTARSDYTPADIRFTVTIQGNLCVTLLAPTAEKSVLVRSLAAGSGVYTDTIESITLLGSKEKVSFRRRKDGLVIDIPAGAPTDTLLSFKIVPVAKVVVPHTTGWVQ